MDCLQYVLLVCLLQVLLLKHLIDYLAEDKDEELKEFVKNFLNPDSSVSLPWLVVFQEKSVINHLQLVNSITKVKDVLLKLFYVSDVPLNSNCG